MSRNLSEFDYVLAMLAHRLAPTQGEDANARRRNGVVFLLGAGCSIQYGLPNFRELLTYLWEDFFDQPLEDPRWSFEMLRDRIDKYWQAQGPEARQQSLGSHLKQVVGRECPGYVRLAQLARDRRVKAVVNMNFDTLFEDALAEQLKGSGTTFKISTSFRVTSDHHLMVYKPHGSLGKSVSGEAVGAIIEAADKLHGSDPAKAQEILAQARSQLRRIKEDRFWVAEDLVKEIESLLDACGRFASAIAKGRSLVELGNRLRQKRERLVQLRKNPAWTENDLILDIANSDLFSDPEEQLIAQELLTGHDVVTIGYSGVDAKIAAALRSFSRGKDPRDKKLFVVNVTRPDPRMVFVMAERASHDLSIVGEEAGFENFMEHLDRMVRGRRGQHNDDVPAEELNLMTRAERSALRECLKLALSIRWSINVADRSSVSIEEHGKKIFSICLDLARSAGIRLTSPEKYLLFCTAFLHDLGYFAAYSGGRVTDGLALLQQHGAKTSLLLQQRFKSDPDLICRIIPSSYDPKCHEKFKASLLELCRSHASYTVRKEGVNENLEVEIEGVSVGIRCGLVQSLFSSAENIVKEHPFLPSSDPILGNEETRSIEDPVIDLYLRRKKDEISFAIERRRVVGRVLAGPSKNAIWLLTLAKSFIDDFGMIAEAEGGLKVEFMHDSEIHIPDPGQGEERLRILEECLVDALENELSDFVDQVLRDAQRESAASLVKVQEILNKVKGDATYLAWVESDAKDHRSLDPSESTARDRTLELVERLTGVVQTRIRTGWVEELTAGLKAVNEVLERIGRDRSYGLDALGVALKSISACLALVNDNIRDESIEAAIATMASVRKWWLNPLLTQHRDSLSREINLSLASASGFVGEFCQGVRKLSAGEVISLLDLVAIYTLSTHPGEPRVELDSDVVRRVLDRVGSAESIPHHCLLNLYLPLKREKELAAKHKRKPADDLSRMDDQFISCFDEIIHPAWRFFARHWHDHSEAVLMARACFDLGSSRFRGEVVGGVKYLLGQVEWTKCEVGGVAQELAHGHDECTLCTSRLLYILSHARRLFPEEELGRFSENENDRSLNETVKGLLSYMMSREPRASSWWGLGSELNEKRGVHAADYLAWSARSVAFCLTVDREVLQKTGEFWLSGGTTTLGLERKKLTDLLRQRWDQLLEAETQDLLSERSEEPQSFTLGRVALAYLDFRSLDPLIQSMAIGDESKVERFLLRIEEIYSKVWHEHLAQMSSFNLWPTLILREELLKNNEEGLIASAETLVDLCMKCLESKIWIKNGPDAGSWGFNVKNTQAIVTALTAFWRHAYNPKNHERFKSAFERYQPDGAVRRGAFPLDRIRGVSLNPSSST